MHSHFLPLVLAVLTLCSTSSTGFQDSAVDPSPVDTTTSQRLATELLRYGNDIIVIRPVTVESIQLAKYFFMEAARLHPENPQIASRLLEMAILAEDRELVEQATKILLSCDPSNQAAQLRRLLQAVDRYQHADERIRAYELMLDDSNIEVIGKVMASRIALKLAMLHRRVGDIDEFSEWLGRSIDLDPFYSEAVAMGAGFFQSRVEDPFVSVELLVTLLLADPADSTTPPVLAHLLMEAGAYESARRMYRLAVSELEADGRGANGDLLADLAISEWASGDADAALNVIQSRQMEADRLYRQMTRQESPTLSPIELARIEAPLTPTLAATRAVIMNERGGPEAEDAISSLIETYRGAMFILDSQEDTSTERAWALIELSWLVLWLDGDVDQVQEWLAQARKLAPMDEKALRRFDGWISFRQGFIDDAAETLEPLAADDPAARLGLAMVREQQGRRQDAARLLLDLARTDAGSLIGVWSRDRLASMIETPIPMSDKAVRMTELIDAIPMAFDRYPSDPRLAFSIDVEPRSETVSPYDPVILDIELMNHAPMPMAISPEGPIQELMLLEPIVQTPHEPPMALAPIVVDVGGRLRLEPYEHITIPFDLRTTWVGSLLNRSPVKGSTVLTTGIVNFRVSNETLQRRTVFAPGLLGSEVTGRALHVEGVRVDDTWAARTITEARSGAIDAQLLANLAVLTHVARKNQSSEKIDPEIIKQTGPVIVDAFDRFDEVQKAWFISVSAQGELLNPINAIVLQGGDDLPKMIHLLRMLELGQPDQLLTDPFLLSSLRSENPRIRQLAEWVEQRAQFMVESEIDRRRSEEEETPSGG
tara:strand:+ start:45094 stop:47571 length:2478 start_codon:yes stop_codon:yes gene_type:complete